MWDESSAKGTVRTDMSRLARKGDKVELGTP